ncbi:MAG: hypothetical protein JXA13_06695 [Anaerolineales bacterium]|nr:hypothetical protein [Anaerolineales bacterium]
MIKNRILLVMTGGIVILGLLSVAAAPVQQTDDASPPAQPVKLIFIHHSTGENWLTDGYGNLGLTLGQNNYFVSDTNYGWGPNGIGDRTDIPDWVEWFRSSEAPTYMEALFNENDQHSSYTRTLSDPGGENQVIMFKSCFPNSALEGSPNDPPGSYADYTVSGAKYVYNELLKYFAAHPDKLFVVITAPPLSDPSHAENARAFNQWLVFDWLNENNYTGSNVAVFDFYNVLTGPKAHHHFVNGNVVHTIGSNNTLNYPSGDDHPSVQGSQKATDEFVPLLNVFYNRWQAGQPPQSPTGLEVHQQGDGSETKAPAPQPPPDNQAPGVSQGLIDDFEGAPPSGASGWEPFWDEGTPTTMVCSQVGQAHTGSQSMQLDFNVAANSWATCALMYTQTQNWSQAEGLSFYIKAAPAGLVMHVDLYAGSGDARESYVYVLETPPDSANGWVLIQLRWEDFHRVDWEEGAGSPFTKPDQVQGMAFGFDTYPDTPNTGTIWVDDLNLMSGQSVEQPTAPAGDQPSDASPAPAAETGRGPVGRILPCGGAAVIPMGLLGLFLGYRKKGKYD